VIDLISPTIESTDIPANSIYQVHKKYRKIKIIYWYKLFTYKIIIKITLFENT